MDNKKEWLWLQVDSRDYKEIQWQAEAISKTLGLLEKCFGPALGLLWACFGQALSCISY